MSASGSSGVERDSVSLAASPQPRVLLLIAAGLCASLIGIGFARFAYTPLIPPLIASRWLDPDAVIYLAAANLLGYLLGAVAGRRVASALGSVAVLKGAMLLTVVSFLACAVPFSTGWFFAWRLISGITGGAIMVLVGSVVLPHVPPERKGMAAGAIFLGLGLGIAASGSLVPFLIRISLSATWIGLALMSFILAMLTWHAWPANVKPTALGSVTPSPIQRQQLRHLYGQYGLMAIGVVPSMVFLVDYAVRGLHWSVDAGSMLWVVFGVGALVGPMAYGAAADRMGFAKAMRIALASQVLATAVLCATDFSPAIVVAAFALGTFPPGAVPLVLGRVNQLVGSPADAQQTAWSRATTAFAIVQAGAGYMDSVLLTASGSNFSTMFALACAAFAIALSWDLLASTGSERSADFRSVR